MEYCQNEVSQWVATWSQETKFHSLALCPVLSGPFNEPAKQAAEFSPGCSERSERSPGIRPLKGEAREAGDRLSISIRLSPASRAPNSVFTGSWGSLLSPQALCCRPLRSLVALNGAGDSSFHPATLRNLDSNDALPAVFQPTLHRPRREMDHPTPTLSE